MVCVLFGKQNMVIIGKVNAKSIGRGGKPMEAYLEALTVMDDLFGRDYQFAMAATGASGPSVRYVDTLWADGCFYIATHQASRKVKETALEPRVSLCARKMYTFSGRAENIGHPLKPENSAIRQLLTEAFSAWYFRHNNENDPGMCYLRIRPESGFFHRDGVGYRVDFTRQTAEIFPFAFDTALTQD